MTTYSIVIPVFNKYNFTKSCINDLSSLLKDHEIIVVNNGSSDETKSELSKIQDPNFKLINLDENEGFAKGCNAGFSQSSGNYVLFLNNDIRVKGNHNSWTHFIWNECVENTLVGPTIGLLDARFNFLSEGKKFGPNFYMSGWCIGATKETWNQLVINDDLGPFSTEFQKAYFEDTDLSFRAKEKSFNFRVVDIPVVHLGRVTSNSIGLSSLYQNAKNIFTKKWTKR